MAEYIERDALLQDIEDSVRITSKTGMINPETRGAYKIIERIKSAAAADVVAVRHGRWEGSTDEWFGTDVYTCSKCRESYVLVEGTPKQNLWHYCPNCGAKMAGE